MATKTRQVIFETIAKLDGYKKMEEANKLLRLSLKGTGVDANNVTKILSTQAQAVQRGSQQFLRFSSEFKTSNGQVQKVTRDLFPLFDTLVTKTNKNTESVKLASNSYKGFGGILTGFGLDLEKIAARALLTVPVWFAVRNAMNFLRQSFTDTIVRINELDEAVRNVRNIFEPFQRTAELTERLKNSFSSLSTEFGKSTKEIGDVGAEIARAGLAPEESLKALDAALKLQTASGADASEVVRALVLSYNLYGDEIRKVAAGQNEFLVISGFLNSVANKNIESLGGFIQVLTASAGPAKTANLSFAELAATLTVLQNLGFGTQAGTIVNRLLTRTVSQAEEQRDLISSLTGGKVQTTGQESIFESVTIFLKAIKDSNLTSGQRLSLIDQFFGERGTRSAAVLENLNKLIGLLDELDDALKNNKNTVSDLLTRVDDVLAGNTKSLNKLGQLFPSILGDLGKIITGGDFINNFLNNWVTNLESVKVLTKEISENDPFKFYRQAVAAPFKAANKIVEGIRNVITFPADQLAKQQIEDLERRKKARADRLKEQEEIKNYLEFVKNHNASVNSVPTTSSANKSGFLFQSDTKQRIKTLIDENKEIEKLGTNTQKIARASADFKAALTQIKDSIGAPVSDELLTQLLQTSPDEIGKFLRGFGLLNQTDIQELFVKALQSFQTLKKTVADSDKEELGRQKQLQEFEIDGLKLLGFKESELSALKLELYRGEADFKDREHKLNLQRLEEERARTLEIFEAIKSTTQSSFEGLLKNEISPTKFFGNIGDTLQNQSIKSSASVFTDALLGTGFAKQFSEALGGVEQNPIVRSFIEGARAAAPILSSSIAQGASGQTGINTGDVTGPGGLAGLFSGLFGGGGFGVPGGQIGPPTQKQAQLQAFGGVAGAGISGLFAGIAAGQRGGTTSGILGGAGGFLSAGGLGALAPALGPLGLLAGAGLTIASFFTSKKPKIESQSSEQLISIAPKIDVTNKKLDIVNRNLVALKSVMEAYVLPDSAYFSESRGLESQFSIYSRRGLI